MRYLLDTSVMIQSLLANPKLSKRAIRILSDENIALYLSAVSVWEIVIKVDIGKLSLPEPPYAFVAKASRFLGLQALDLSQFHALGVAELPFHHRDPFDRMLIAQARAENLVLLTSDRVFEKYNVEMVYCGR